MKVIKPQKLGVTCRSFEQGDDCFLAVAVLLFAPFDASSGPLSEVGMWKFLATELGKEGSVDMGFPKKRAEVIVNARAYPTGGPRSACPVRLRLGSVDKTLHVFGDRVWHRGAPTEPENFSEMPIIWENAFGGEGFPSNPVGKGFAPVVTRAGEVRPLPNVEDPRRLVRDPADRPPPAGFGPYDFTWPQRYSKIGTYDAAWLKTDFPGLAADLDYAAFNAAPPDQQVDGYFRGDEDFRLEGMHPTRSVIEGRLPGLATRVFVTLKTEVGEEFGEVSTALETVRLFPHAERMVLIFRGLVRVAEDDAADVLHLVAACETFGQPRPVDHYRAVLAQRLDRKKGALSALRDSDLMPPRTSGQSPPSPVEVGETQGMLATEGLQRKNLRRRAELQREEARAKIVAMGLDPEKYGPPALPPEEPPPDLENLAALVEHAKGETDKAKATLEQQRKEGEARARKLCEEAGKDYDALVAEGARKGGGPPRFSAREEEQKLRGLAALGREHGAPNQQLEAMLADGTLEARLLKAEEKLREAYRQFAHHFPPAQRLSGEAVQRMQAEVRAALAAGESFAGRDLTGADLSGFDLRRTDFTGAMMEAANLSGADLSGADLSSAVLARADLSGARFTGAKLSGANLGEARFRGADFSGGVDLTGATLYKADLDGADLRGAMLEKANLSEAVFGTADLRDIVAPKMTLLKTSLAGARFAGANLSRAVFLECDLTGADFSGATLTKTSFISVRGAGANFSRAVMSNTVMVKDCDFAGSDFRGASLDGANFRGTKLGGSDFSLARMKGADLSECDLRGAKLFRVMAREARFLRADLTDAVMVSIDLMDGILQKARIGGANLQGANLFRADMARTRADAQTNMEGANVKHVRVVPPRRTPSGA